VRRGFMWTLNSPTGYMEGCMKKIRMQKEIHEKKDSLVRIGHWEGRRLRRNQHQVKST
jgi:hypothetical protein